MTKPSEAQQRPAHDGRFAISTRRDFLVRGLGLTAAFGGLVVRPREAAADPQTSGAAWEARHDLTDARYRAEFQRLWNENYRLVDVCGYQVGSQARYAAIWERPRRRVDQWSRHEIPFAEYQDQFDRLKADGFRPVRINGYNINRQAFFAAIYEKSPGPPWWTNHNIKASELQATFDRLDRDGFRLVDVCGYRAPNTFGETLFAAIWERADGRHWGWIPSRASDAYQTEFRRTLSQGYFPVRVSGFLFANREQNFTAVLEKSEGRTLWTRHGIESRMYQHEFDHLKRRGYRPVFVGGYTADYGNDTNAVQAFCPVWEKRDAGPVITHLATDFMKRCEVPGLSVAVAKDGRLVYAQGFGVADQATGEKVTPSSLFRIASLSKPITAVAIMRLIEDGRFRLTDTVFGSSGLLEPMFGGTRTYGTDITRITVQHLLEHSSGGWPTAPDNRHDPMFASPALNHRELIENELGTNLSDLGGNYAYSNFGYCVLGRIIEQVTGQRYDEYVRERILAPCGITGMQLAGNTRADRRPREVVYYDGGITARGIRDPYGMNVTRMDSHGGWLATAVDLLRFAVRVDGFPTPPDILNSASITTMTRKSTAARPRGEADYAKGWAVNDASTWWHFGNLPGSESFLARTADGYCWAVLINTSRREPRYKNTATGLDHLMWAIRDQVDHWPAGQAL